MPLLDSYLPTLALTLGYLLIVWLGPKYMNRRQPYSCRGAMMLYNLGITILSFGMFSEVNDPAVCLCGAARLTGRRQKVFFIVVSQISGPSTKTSTCSAGVSSVEVGAWRLPELRRPATSHLQIKNTEHRNIQRHVEVLQVRMCLNDLLGLNPGSVDMISLTSALASAFLITLDGFGPC